jgi:hypothetical protein
MTPEAIRRMKRVVELEGAICVAEDNVIAIARDLAAARPGTFLLLENAIAALDRAVAKRATEGSFPTLIYEKSAGTKS